MTVSIEKHLQLCLVACLSLFSVWGQILAQESDTSSRAIPAAIAEFEAEFSKVERSSSTTEQRRLCKRLVRNSESLLKKYTHDLDRYRVLATLFRIQQLLVSLDDSDRYREALFKTCESLAKAPDDLAELRLPADIMLTRIAISREDMAEEGVTTAITDLVARYKGTRGEPDSLMAAALLAKGKGLAELLKRMRTTMEERCKSVPRIRAFMREFFQATDRQFVFRCDLKRLDGATIRFPQDRIGKPYMVVFWSEEDADVSRRLKEIEKHRQAFAGRFEIYSCNLDEMSDCGQNVLKRLALDWIVLNCPKGLQNDAYLAYGRTSDFPFAFLVINELGYVRGQGYNWGGFNPSGEVEDRSPIESELERVLSSRQTGVRDPSYFALMQSLLIGDYLVAEPLDKSLAEIQACFPGVVVRCRLSREEALSNYRKADKLCANALKKSPGAHHLRDRRIVALMGQWKLTGDERFLKQATVLAKTSPAGMIVPQFCIARNAIREDHKRAKEAVAAFITACGGERAPGVARCAAAVLALEACERDLFLQQRAVIINSHMKDERTWPVSSFFMQRNSVLMLFRASGTYSRGYLEDDLRHGRLKMDLFKPMPFHLELETLKGEPVSFPKYSMGKHTIVVFARMPSDGEQTGVLNELVNGYRAAVKDHRMQEMQLLLVLLTNDQEAAKELVSRNRWDFDVACSPGGAKGELAVLMGAFSDERVPKTYLIGPDGTIEGRFDSLLVSRSYHGLLQSRDRHRRLFIHRAVKIIVRTYDVEVGRAALAKQQYKEAAHRLQISFPHHPVNKYNRAAYSSYQANQALGNWKEALRDVRVCIKDPGMRSKGWQARLKKIEAELVKKCVE